MRSRRLRAALALARTSGNTACSDEAVSLWPEHHLDRAKERLQYLGEQVATMINWCAMLKVRSVLLNQQSQPRKHKRNKSRRIQTLTTENTKLREEIPLLITKVGEITHDLDKLTAEVTVLSSDVTRIGNIVTQQEVGYANEQNLFKKLEEQLIEDVLSANRMGYAKSRSDGQRDGIEVARVVGDDLGERNGKAEGQARGITDGRAREYTRGKEQGEKEGALKGREDGLAQGDQRGREEGHQLAGTKEGEAAGLARAESSDAAQVGRRLGLQEGVQQARVEGERRGRGAGEAEAIQQMENRPLSSEVVRGPFAGTFANKLNLPAFPGARGNYRNDESGHSRRIIRLAYIAGYSVGYDRAAEEVYYANIEAIYTEAYNRFYQVNYQAAVNQAYPDAPPRKDEQYKKHGNVNMTSISVKLSKRPVLIHWHALIATRPSTKMPTKQKKLWPLKLAIGPLKMPAPPMPLVKLSIKILPLKQRRPVNVDYRKLLKSISAFRWLNFNQAISQTLETKWWALTITSICLVNRSPTT